MKKSGAALLLGGGMACIGAVLLAVRKSGQTTDAIREAVERPGAPTGTQPRVNVRLTGYWPFQPGLTEKQQKMEGGVTDRKGRPLYTLEMFQSGKAPYVSVAGDYEIWPDGQRVGISAWPNVIFRVVDTGGHFHGINKVFRVVGEEPLDVCVQSSSTVVPKKNIYATIYPGDNFEGGRAVATAKFKDQVVSGTIDPRVAAAEAIVGAYFEALEEGLS